MKVLYVQIEHYGQEEVMTKSEKIDVEMVSSLLETGMVHQAAIGGTAQECDESQQDAES